MKTLHSQQFTNRATARFIYEVGNGQNDRMRFAEFDTEGGTTPYMLKPERMKLLTEEEQQMLRRLKVLGEQMQQFMNDKSAGKIPEPVNDSGEYAQYLQDWAESGRLVASDLYKSALEKTVEKDKREFNRMQEEIRNDVAQEIIHQDRFEAL